ncbi:MAG TPA: SAM-dependent chlorinase/fluorinase [Baekduia sp.]|uniref:SAM hydrolase/SAM-dependent halogenase family protein n=1 Tax=Baekduia sp. TaxID=2600305 RepID=UPI002D79D4C5|nr:SAM-dependent chlorinase/fluorinase [Baekduia sp.]HET6508712.1 SAM-dependent chlorinase/fluorinase [Baekduia sp.]
MARPITFLSDYGLEDDFVGVCHAVMARIAPGARIVDLTHGLDRHDVRTAAMVLRRALPFSAPGVHLAVVDPGVGTARRGIALKTTEEDRILVGPDNGLLSLAAQRFGGIAEVVDVARSPHRLEPVSATFHGRDIFAPVAAHLAAGAELADAGDPIDADEIVRLDMPLAFLDEDGELYAHAVGFDRFGNIMLDVEHAELTGSGFRLGHGVEVNGRPGVYATTFADVPAGELILYEDAYRTLALAVNRGSARELLGVARDDELRIRPR